MDQHSGHLCDRRPPHAVGARIVFTIEPGIYIPEEQLGVRIEDDILVTPEGSEILSIGAPRTTEDIERLMQSAAEPHATGSN